jgi:hypothetical protein
MHDLSYFRTNFEKVAERLATRGGAINLEGFRELDKSRRSAISQAEQLKARKNQESAEIGKLKREGADTTERQKEVRAIADQIAALDEQVKAVDEQFQSLLAGIPNIPQESVPIGKSAEDNVEVRRVGEPTKFDFEPKAHWDLGPELGILDFERPLGPRSRARHPRFRARRQNNRRPICSLLGRRRPAGARPHQFLPRCAYARARLHGSASAIHGQLRQPLRHRPASEIRRRSVQV